MRASFVLPVILLLALVLSAQAAPAKPRPYAGQGLLLMRPPVQKEEGGWRLVLYREPGIGRLGEKAPAQIPLLRRVVLSPAEDYPVAVMGRKAGWVKIEYDDGGRTGWISLERRWTWTPWEEALPGRTVRLLPGVNKNNAVLRETPSPSAAERALWNPGDERRVEQVQGDWVAVSLNGAGIAWLRWRDESGRFVASFGPAPGDDRQ